MTNGFDYSQYQTDASAQESQRMKDGLGGKSIFVENLMRDIPRYKETVGIHLMDIIMYPAGANHPMVVKGRIKQETMVHITWAFVHKAIGPGQDWIICLAKTYGQRCPICEFSNMIRANSSMSDEEVKAATKPYYSGKYPLGIYNCIHHADPNAITWSEPVMMWDINNSFMEFKLQAQAKQSMITEDNPTGFINYQWPTAGVQGGRHIGYNAFMKGPFFDFDGHKFYVRKAPVPPNVLQSVRCLDDLFHVPTFDEVKDSLELDVEMRVQQDAGAGQPTGEGVYTGPEAGEYVSPGPALFGQPEPQCPYNEYEGVFGVTFDKFQECRTCTLMVECQAKMPPPVEAPKVAAPTSAAPTLAPPAPAGYVQGTAAPRPTPPPGVLAPIARRAPK